MASKPTVMIQWGGDTLRFQAFLKKQRFRRHLKRKIRSGTIRAALYLIKQVKVRIRGRNYVENAPMTLALKKSNLPLLDDKQLWDALSYELENAFKAEVGIVVERASTGSKVGKSRSMPIQQLAEMLHDGFTIRVTHKMKLAIISALHEKQTKTGRLTKKSKTALKTVSNMSSEPIWRVPKRPFLTDVWADPKVRKEVRKIWTEALNQVWRAQGAKGKDWKNR